MDANKLEKTIKDQEKTINQLKSMVNTLTRQVRIMDKKISSLKIVDRQLTSDVAKITYTLKKRQ